MKLIVAAVSARAPSWIQEGWAEYSRRLPRACPLLLHEVRPAPRKSGKSPAQLMEAEAAGLRAVTPKGTFTIALDERGRDMSTADIGQQMAAWDQAGRDIVFLIGGPDGLHADIKTQADACWRLSSLTLPHPLVRIVLAEQLYRAWTMLNNHPYHRA